MSQSPNAAAMPMLAAAGIVVTLINTPISAPDLAVLRLSMPGRAGAGGDDERERVRARDDLRRPWSPLSKSSGIRPAP